LLTTKPNRKFAQSDNTIFLQNHLYLQQSELTLLFAEYESRDTGEKNYYKGAITVQ